MSDFTRSLEGWDQLAWLVLSFNQSVTRAIKTMTDHNQDMGFLDHPSATDGLCRLTLIWLKEKSRGTLP